MQNLGVFWKIQDICYVMGTEIFKIEEEMPEKMKPEVANPPSKNRQNSLLTLCTPLMILCNFNFGLHFLSHFFFNFENLSAHLVANILNFPKHPQLLHFG